MHLEFPDTFGDRFEVFGHFFPGEGAFREHEFRAFDAPGLPLATIAARLTFRLRAAEPLYARVQLDT